LPNVDSSAAGDLVLPPRPGPADSPGEDERVRWIHYTSGTTAAPKGVLHMDASVMAAAAGCLAAIRPGPDDLYPVAFPVAHIGGVVMLTAALASGLRLLLVDTLDAATSPATMAAHRATILGSATPFFHAYLAAQAEHSRELPGSRLFPGLRVGISGGAG
jgi:acyl-coenzyme A synthetase/AMP-(fatty) acid ligase